MITTERPTQKSLSMVCALLIVGVLAVFGFRSLNDQLWSDELLGMSLLQAGSLSKLWSGIALGIDGNPPFYLTAAWLITHPLPPLVSPVAVLKLLNLALAAGGVLALGRVALRGASPSACWIGAVLFITLCDAFSYAASELRTYALYFLMAALAVLFQQRLIEHRRLRDIAALSLVYAGLAMAHTYGIVYVGIIALAGWLSQVRGGKSLLGPIALAVAPAVIAVAAWSPFLLEQLQVARPYNWMMPPTLSGLLDTLFGSDTMIAVSILEALCLLTAGIAAVKHGGLRLRAILDQPGWQPARFGLLVLAGVTGFTLAGWLFSNLVSPVFVPRFFTPQLFTAFALHVGFAEWLWRTSRQHRAMLLAICIVIAPLMLRNVVLHARGSVHGKPICADASGKFFETGFIDGSMPVIVDSAHMFLPRATYAEHGEVYRFALDWDVVLNHPFRSRANAVDYHLMQDLQAWLPMPQIESTDDIIGKYPQFLVIEQPYRAWFLNLATTRNIVAEKLAEKIPAGEDEISCTLWKVSRVEKRP